MNRVQLPVPLRKSEINWGIRYLLFELIFLGPLLIVSLKYLFPGVTDAHINAAYFLVNFLAVGLIFRKYLKDQFRYTLSHIPRVLFAAGVGFVVYFVLSLLIEYAITAAAPDFFNVNDAGIAQDSRGHLLLTAIGTVLLVPAAEELLHRGLVFGILQGRSRVLAYLLSTCLFAFIHIMGYVGLYAPWQLLLCFIQYVPAGLILAWAYESSGSILAPIAIHTAVNGFALLSLR